MCNMELIPLISNYQRGKRSDFPKLYNIFKNLIGCYSNRLHFDDALQELNVFFVELLSSIKLDKFIPDNSINLKKYISVAIRNKFIAISKQYQQDAFIFVEFCEDIAITEISFEDDLMFTNALSLLTQRQAQIIIYKYVWEYSDTDISRILHISRQSVNRLKKRGLLILKKYYTE